MTMTSARIARSVGRSGWLGDRLRAGHGKDAEGETNKVYAILSTGPGRPNPSKCWLRNVRAVSPSCPEDGTNRPKGLEHTFVKTPDPHAP